MSRLVESIPSSATDPSPGYAHAVPSDLACFYVRFGDPSHVAKLPSRLEHARGDHVVISSRRGVELGTIVGRAEERSRWTHGLPSILYAADSDAIAAARRARSDRDARFEICRELFEASIWPFQLIDVEPLLEGRTTVIYYLGPHGFDFEGLRDSLRSGWGIEAVFEPVGRDAEPESEVAADPTSGCGDCGSGCGSGEGGSCGSGAGCGSKGDGPGESRGCLAQ